MTPDRRFQNEAYDQIAIMARALANPRRLELLNLLSQSPKGVDRLVAESGLGLTSVSQHLQILKQAHLVMAHKKGTRVIYEISDDAIPEFLRSLRVCAERYLPELEQVTRRFLSGRDGMSPIDRDRLRHEVLMGSVVVLDVRPRDEYEIGHIPGARSVPLEELELRLSELPRDKDIVAYCRGPYCVLAIQAVERLRGHGFHATRLEDGVTDWKSRSLPFSRGAE